MTKEELKEYKKMKLELKQINEYITKLNYDKDRIKSPLYSDMPKSFNIDNSIENILIRLEEETEKYYNLYEKAIEKRIEIENNICTLESPLERTLMRYRYIECKSWEEICILMNYAWAQTHRIHARALKNIS